MKGVMFDFQDLALFVHQSGQVRLALIDIPLILSFVDPP